jgi:hypothetical protein
MKHMINELLSMSPAKKDHNPQTEKAIPRDLWNCRVVLVHPKLFNITAFGRQMCSKSHVLVPITCITLATYSQNRLRM